ncbi:hypothetical protein O3P69_006267 [Scylla paramamosain]|uniref:Uncharacterized protein n=2 Tax=Scylla paramamosain TaxID=85552 RepID=A0AAW0U9J2_SCYPA
MVTPAAVPSPLPEISSVHLVFSGVNESLMEEACQMAAVLLPRRGYYGIAFPGARMEAAQWRHLLHLMAAAGDTVWGRGLLAGVWIPQQTITLEEWRELTHLADTLWGCMVIRLPDKACFLHYLLHAAADDDDDNGDNGGNDDDDDDDDDDDEEEEEEEEED